LALDPSELHGQSELGIQVSVQFFGQIFQRIFDLDLATFYFVSLGAKLYLIVHPRPPTGDGQYLRRLETTYGGLPIRHPYAAYLY
jgi:hypothetical protein